VNFLRRWISRRASDSLRLTTQNDPPEQPKPTVTPNRDGTAAQLAVDHTASQASELKVKNDRALASFKEHLRNEGIDPDAEFCLPEPCPAAPSRRSAIAANTFAFRLIREMCAASQKENVLIAPFGMEVALAVVSEGATGDTKSEIEDALQLSSMKEIVAIANHYAERSQHKPDLGSGKAPDLELATSLWVDKRLDVRPKFIDDAQHYYAAETFSVEMNSADTQSRMDSWANEKTHGLIPHVPAAVDSATVMALVNAIYFRGLWSSPFKVENTRPAEFYLSDGTTVMRQRMSRKLTCRYHEQPGLQAVRLLYLGERFSMCVYLPDDIEAFRTQLTADAWASMRFESLPGTVELPRTKLHCLHSDLVCALSTLGIKRVFTKGAELDGIAPEVFAGKVAQQVRVEVDEEGTEAAAVTMVTFSASIGPRKVEKPREFRFIVDRPYFFTIEDAWCNRVLFAGLVRDPGE
jgi:serine protease inhibitor